MPRYDDRSTRLYVGHLSSRTRSRDLDDLFCRYGRVRDVDMKRDFAFVEFSDYRDADDARCDLDGREFIGSRIVVEFAKGVPRGHGGSRDHMAKGGPPPGTGRCFNCGLDGHWARDCENGDWKNKCYRCGERGHIERNCQNSPKKLKRGRSYSRSPSPRRGRSPLPHRGRSPRRSPRRRHSRSLSYSRSRSYSHSLSPSPPPNRSPKRHRTSPRPYDRSPSGRESPSPRARREDNGSDYSISPRRSQSPVVDADRDSPRDRRTYRSPVEENGKSPSPSPIPSPIPRADRPRSDDDGGYSRGSPGRSDSA